MTHAQLAQRLPLNTQTYRTPVLLLLAFVVLALAGNYILMEIFDVKTFRIIYSDQTLGLRLEEYDRFTPWHAQLGLHSMLPIFGFVTGIIFAAEFRASLGSGLTRRAVWFDNLRDLTIVTLMISGVLFVTAAIFYLIDTPRFVAGEDNLWLSLVVLFAMTWLMCQLGYLISIAYVRLHWAIPTLGIVLFLVAPGLLEDSNLVPQKLIELQLSRTFHPLQLLTYVLLTVTILCLTFLLIRTLPMRRR